mmetsp:Transcript_18894/g.27953  ORF Transcript_18894/g.27953 Transcript_18894/m.27953 type:complete len:161 (+) Transcript_18894:373-855(+)
MRIFLGGLSFALTLSVLRGSAFPVGRFQHSRNVVLTRSFSSVTGTIYSAMEKDAPIVRLFTKEGCTLCDKVKETLESLRDEIPHSLEAVDITDSEHTIWHDKYKYDIPVLHVGEHYWTKHRVTSDEARKSLCQARSGSFKRRSGEPDAGEMERRQEARKA